MTIDVVFSDGPACGGGGFPEMSAEKMVTSLPIDVIQ